MSPYQCSCCDAYLEETEVAHRLFDVFRKWEVHGVTISKRTLADYPNDIVLTLYRCKACGFGVFLPMITGSDVFYTDITRKEYYLADRWDFHVAIKAFRSEKARSVLDVGCGQGAFLKMVMEQLPGVVCHGNDGNPAIRDVLPSDCTLHAKLADAPDDLDAVTLFQVIEHVADPVGLLKESVAKVRVGGLVVVSVPDHSGPVRFFADSHTAIPPHHVSIWTPASLDALLCRLGLSIVSRKKEPLPDYLMSSYLPKILSNVLRGTGNPARKELFAQRLSRPIVDLCKRFGVKSLPIPGHTYLVLAKKN